MVFNSSTVLLISHVVSGPETAVKDTLFITMATSVMDGGCYDSLGFVVFSYINEIFLLPFDILAVDLQINVFFLFHFFH